MNNKKIQKLLMIGVVMIGFVLLKSMFQSPIMATIDEYEEPQKISSSENIMKSESQIKRDLEKMLRPIENEQGLKAIPKALLLARNAPFPDLENPEGIYELLKELVIPSTSTGAKYKYVDAAGEPVIPSSKKIGFQKVYVEITAKESLSSIRVPIPVSVIDEKSINNKKLAKTQSNETSKKASAATSDLVQKDYITVKRNATLDPTTLDTKSITRSAVSTYEWVKNKTGEPTEPNNHLDTTESGFQWGYLKVSNEELSGGSTVFQLPIMVTDDKDTAIVESDKVGFKFNSDQLRIMTNEINGKTHSEIAELLKKKLDAKAWDLTKGTELDTQILNATIDSTSLGVKTISLVTKGEKESTRELPVIIYPDGVFEGEDPSEWKDIPLNSDTPIVNPINGSKIGFHGRVAGDVSTVEGFVIQDKQKEQYVSIANLPGMNNRVIYDPNNQWYYQFGIGVISVSFAKTEFLSKDNKLKQILVDSKNQLILVYNLSLNRDLNFVIKLDMYNMSSEVKSLALLEIGRINSEEPIYALGNNSGFYWHPKSGKRVSFKLKNSRSKWLSAYKKYSIINPIGLETGNMFGTDFSISGEEIKNSKPGEQIKGAGDNLRYQFGAPWRDVLPGEALKTEYEVFLGDEIPYMELKSEPNRIDIYEDYEGQFQTTYHLSKIPTTNSFGTLEVIYPDGSKEKVNYKANQGKEFSSKVTIPREKFPKHLNEEEGTIKTYSTSTIASEETAGTLKGIVSNEEVVDVNVYNLGAKPFPQLIKKGEKLKKSAKELVIKPVILPGHTATYKYEGDTLETLDTSTTGAKSVMVRMIDTQQPEETALIEVPVYVLEDTPPVSGTYLNVEDFQSDSVSFQNVSKSELEKLILKKSKAYAWDIQTGASEGIKLSVKTTTLTANPEEGEYTAVVQADKNSVKINKTVKITIRNRQKVNIKFIDESGEELHQPIVFDELIGTTIDLTNKEKVQQAIQSIYDKKYQLAKKPENETAIPVKAEESTVAYQFEGKLFVQSSPTFLNFGRKSLGLPFIKVEKARYDKPLVIWDNRKTKSCWTLTATLKKPLTSREDPSKVLAAAIRYKVDDKQTIILSENQVAPIAVRIHGEENEYDISREWDDNKSGMILEVPSGEVLQAGAYRAKILWRVEQAP